VLASSGTDLDYGVWIFPFAVLCETAMMDEFERLG
jgi:hypothetical protein